MYDSQRMGTVSTLQVSWPLAIRDPETLIHRLPACVPRERTTGLTARCCRCTRK